MGEPLKFTCLQQSATSQARLGRIETPHGAFDTPTFMPVGTKASIKGLTPEQVRDTGTQIILANAFHLMLRPGDDHVAHHGGLHQYMKWDGPILTDSGGYQVFSLSHLRSIDDDGVTFASIVDGSPVHLGPERSMEIQNNLGADIIMAFDECPSSVHGNKTLSKKMKIEHREHIKLAHERTVKWLHRCASAHKRKDEQALFGIVQGGLDLELRKESVKQICDVELPGYAIGGVAVGETSKEIQSIVEFTAPLLPAERPRYLMGVGYERDIVTAVRAGVDMFDCVLPTRNGRNANAFTRTGRLHLRNASMREDDSVIDCECDCYACRGGFSRAYLRHLFQSDEMLGPILVSIHNIHHYQRLMLDIRRAIRDDAWREFENAWPVAFEAETTPSDRGDTIKASNA